MKHLRPVLLAAALAVSTTHAHAFLHEWTVKRVDGLDGSLFTFPTDINNAGQVVGSSTVNGRSRGFLYSEGRTIDLGTFGGTQSAATAINEQGQVTGWALGTGDTVRQAFLYSGGIKTPLSVPGATDVRGVDVNDRGQVVASIIAHAGGAIIPNGAVIFNPNGTHTNIGTLGGNSMQPVGINNAGQVAASDFLPPFSAHGVIYSNGRLTDIGTLGGRFSDPTDINESGDVVGRSQPLNSDTDAHPFLYRNGTMTDLTPTSLPSVNRDGRAVDINDRGDVVGWSRHLPGFGGTGGFLYSNGQLTGVGGSLGGFDTYALAINNQGHIVGAADRDAFFFSDGEITNLTRYVQDRFNEQVIILVDLDRQMLLNDAGQIVLTGFLPSSGIYTMFVLTPIPEPSTYVLILTGVCTLGFVARRRKAVFGNGPHGETAPTSAVSCLR